jgi:penicillin amidase
VLPRLVRIVNIGIAVVVLLLATAVYWYAIRPLPKTSGEIVAPVRGPATIKRDARGIPHVEASNWQDAIFLQGYATAQDRLWQMDGLRRFGAGELAEVFGPASVARDEMARKMRIRALAQAGADRLPPEQRAVFIEFARGVNYFISTHRGNYSLEFSLPGHEYDPRPWTIVDSLVVGIVMFRDLSDSASVDLDRQQLFSRARDGAKMKVLFPAVEGGAVAPGSNAWAVSGAHTVDGKPMLANDPHLAYGIPPTWYLVHLKAPGLNVSGATLPGVPCVLVGHNEHIAWGITALESDSVDLYREQLDPRTGRYPFAGHVEQAQLETEFIGVRGAKAAPLQTWITRHGPVLATDDHGIGYSLHWTANDGLTFPFWDINRAQNWQQFQTAARTLWGPALNFVYADRDGNIGYQAAGKVPIRRNFDGAVPIDGASGQFEWEGYIPAEQMPSVLNPPSGIVASANQNPFPPDFPVQVSGNYHSRYRIDQIRALLSAKKLDVTDMLAIQKDVYAAYDHFLARQVVAAVASKNAADPLVREAAAVLLAWDGQMDKDHAAPMVTQLLSSRMGLDLVRSNLQPAKSPDHESPPPLLPKPEVIEGLLRTRPAGWVPRDDWDQWIVQNLIAALRDGRGRQGSPVSKWRWGHVLQWNFLHPVGRNLPIVDRYFDIGPVEMSGSGTTVKQTTGTLGPSERMVIDFGDLDRSLQNLTTGESGAVASAHYKDEWPAYYVGTSFPMEFQYIDAKEILHIQPN